MIKLINILKESWDLNKERYKVTLSDGSEIDVKLKDGTGKKGVYKAIEEEITLGRFPKGTHIKKIESKASRPTLYSKNNLLKEQEENETQVKVIPISFDIEWNDKIGKVKQDITLAMSNTSNKVFELGEDIEEYSGLSKDEAEAYEETPTDAYVYGLCQPMNGGKDIFFWTNGTRLAGAADEVGVWPALFEQVSHECIHLTRLILTKHILNNENWVDENWPSIGEQDNDDIDEEALTTATGKVVEQLTDSFLAMAGQYIPDLTENIRKLK